MRVEAFSLHAVVGGAVLTITNRALNDARRLRIGVRIADRFPRRRQLLIEALRATINGCSASVTESGGWCVAAPVEWPPNSAPPWSAVNSVDSRTLDSR